MRIIDINDYELSGGGKLGESYIHKTDSDVLLKLYSHQLEELGLSEYERACKVHDLGIPCPTPGEQVRTQDGRLGILYKRALGKKSYARALSEHPENLKQYAQEFAQMSRQLHQTVPPKGMFPNIKDQYKKEILLNPYMTDKEKEGINRFIDKLPDAPTAVHGDLHYGNIIFTPDGRKYFIDLSDFSTGTPLFDIGILFLQACWMPEEMEMELYHITTKTSRAFWEAFIPEYFGPDAKKEEVEAMVSPYAALRILEVERHMGEPVPFVHPMIQRLIDSI
ncbi:MAG: phosphotransferase [Bacteroidaceae bacterium]|nr:phosphotransferase [Bacteroidaceae bacterium]